MSMEERRRREEPPSEEITWPDLAIGLYDRLTGRRAEITYEFENMEVEVPSGTGERPEFARWRLNGTLRISTRER